LADGARFTQKGERATCASETESKLFEVGFDRGGIKPNEPRLVQKLAVRRDYGLSAKDRV